MRPSERTAGAAARVDYIDIAKGLSIALVALHHSKLRLYYPEIIDSMGLFRLPLFFFLSGVFFSANGTALQYVIRKADVLLKPYFVVLLTLLAFSALSGDDALLWKYKGILYGNSETIRWPPLWYLTHLFAVYLFGFVLFRACRFPRLPLAAQLLILLALLITGALGITAFWHQPLSLGPLVLDDVPGLPYSVDLLPVTGFFLLAGTLLRQGLKAFRPQPLLVLVTALLYLWIATQTEAMMHLNQRQFEQPVFAIIGAFAGIYLALSLSWLLALAPALSRFPRWLGESSLFILMFHGVIGGHAQGLLAPYAGDHAGEVAVAAVSFMVSITAPPLIRALVRRSRWLSLAFLPVGKAPRAGPAAQQA